MVLQDGSGGRNHFITPVAGRYDGWSRSQRRVAAAKIARVWRVLQGRATRATLPSCNGCNEVIPTAGAGLQHHVGVLQHLHRYGRRSGPDAPKPLVLEGALPGADRRTDAHCLGGLGRTGSANHGGAAVSQTDATCSNGGLKHRGRTVCSGEGILLTLSPREKGDAIVDSGPRSDQA